MQPHGVGAVLNRLRGLSFVTRWNFHPTTRKQNVAEHSFWVATYAMIIADMENAFDPPELYQEEFIIRAALYHDWEEAVTGDLPSLVKRVCKKDWEKVASDGFFSIINLLHPEHPINRTCSLWRPPAPIARIVKAADLLDRLMYGQEEKMRGNTSFDRIIEETIMQLRNLEMRSINIILFELGYESEGVELPRDMTHL